MIRQQRASHPRSSPARRCARHAARRAGKAFTPELAPTLERVLEVIRGFCPDARKWLTLNVAILTVAMMQLWRGARSGHGYLTLAALSRTMPLEANEKARAKRLLRLLRNQFLEGPRMTPLLVLLAVGPQARGWVPIVVDQTTICGTPTLMAGVRVAHRILPVAFACFQYNQLPKSQNAIEEGLLALVAASLPWGCKPLYVMDRGYARTSLLALLHRMGIPYLIRGRRNTMVVLGGRRMLLGRVPHRKGKAVRYDNVLYQDQQRRPIDLVVYHDPAFREPWYLLLPCHSAECLPTDEAVALYRERMHIELTLRDWKTHLGVRGLRLQVDIALRLEKLLLALTVAYILVILLGAGPPACRVRRDCEVLRTRPRHGTRRRLSALTVGILLISLARFAPLAEKALAQLLASLARGMGARRLAVPPP